MDKNTVYTQLEWKSICDRGIISPGNLYPFQRAVKKAIQGQALRIGFIGGSITAGSLARSSSLCYAYLVYRWFQDKFPMSDVQYINAGIGATTSRLGVARVTEDILSHSPDVVFVEFSVNDSNEEKFMDTYEGLIRRILLHSGKPAVILINSVAYDTGINAQEIHNRVGSYYGLPIVSMKESLFIEVKEGRLPVSMITPDNLHPNDLGHSLVADVIINLLERMYDEVLSNSLIDAKYEIPDKTITDNSYVDSVLWNNKNYMPELKGFMTDEAPKEGLWDVFKLGWYGFNEGSSIRFNIKCKSLAVLYRKYAKRENDTEDFYAPLAELVPDNRIEDAIILDSRFNEDWGDLLYVHEIMKDSQALEHVIEITVTKEAKGRGFYIAAIITT